MGTRYLRTRQPLGHRPAGADEHRGVIVNRLAAPVNPNVEVEMDLRRPLRAVPPIARRDARIGELRARERELAAQVRRLSKQVERLEREVGRGDSAKYSPEHPSWHGRVQEQARVGKLTRRLDSGADFPRRRLLQKLHNYELARSHGVATPQVLGRWDRIEDVPWTDLPEQFVLKSNRGYSGRGVFPLRRVGERFRLLDGERELTAAELTEHYRTARGVQGPFFAEEVLPGSVEVLPDDVKIYAFYGEVADILLRRVPRHGEHGSVGYRFIDAHGTDLGQVQQDQRPDPSIDAPQPLEVMVETARRLSRAVPVPFVRVDLYQVGAGVVLGELTPLPGSSETFTVEHDRYLGGLYDEAEARLLMDLSHGRPYTIDFGPGSTDLSVPLSPTTVLPPLPD